MPYAPATHRPIPKLAKPLKRHAKPLAAIDKALHRSTWQRFRRLFLSKRPLCDTCGTPGEHNNPIEVHHKLSRAERPDLMYVEDNCQALCRSCHSRVTARETGGGGVET